jgi:extracellular factor (EF) 3-hydroxypalmitic acid methyl ester biosynthesis protein
MWRVASRYFHERFGALVDLSPFAARCFREPLGYAGDFEMMNMVYRNDSLGGTPLRPGTEPRRPR